MIPSAAQTRCGSGIPALGRLRWKDQKFKVTLPTQQVQSQPGVCETLSQKETNECIFSLVFTVCLTFFHDMIVKRQVLFVYVFVFLAGLN